MRKGLRVRASSNALPHTASPSGAKKLRSYAGFFVNNTHSHWMVGAHWRWRQQKKTVMFYFMLRTFAHTPTAKSRESAFASRVRATVTNHKGNYVKRILAEPPPPTLLTSPRTPQLLERGTLVGPHCKRRLRLRRKLEKYAADDYLLRLLAFAAARQFQLPHATSLSCLYV